MSANKLFFYFSIIFLLIFKNASASYTSDSLKKQNKFDFGIEGSIGFSLCKDFYAFNAGGPSLNLRITKNFKLGVGAFPSFYFRNGIPGARLGVGPRLGYKKISLNMPSYFFDSTGKWIITVGFGYTFTK